MKLWNWNRKTIVDDPQTEQFTRNNHAISPCGRYLVVFNFVESLLVFRQISAFLNLVDSDFESKGSVKTVMLEGEQATCLCFCSDDSEQVIVGGKSGKLIRVFNPFFVGLPSKHKITYLYESGNKIIVKNLVTNAKNSHVLAIACSEEDDATSSFHIVDVQSLNVIYSSFMSDFGINVAVNASCFVKAATGQFQVFIGTDDCKIYVFLVEKVNESSVLHKSHLYQTLIEHDSPLKVLKLSQDAQTLFSGSSGRTKRLWQAKEVNYTKLLQLMT